MDRKQKAIVSELRDKGKSWQICAEAVGLPTSTVYSAFKKRTSKASKKRRAKSSVSDANWMNIVEAIVKAEGISADFKKALVQAVVK